MSRRNEKYFLLNNHFFSNNLLLKYLNSVYLINIQKYLKLIFHSGRSTFLKRTILLLCNRRKHIQFSNKCITTSIVLFKQNASDENFKIVI